MALAAGASEFFGGGLPMLGLATPLAAVLIGSTMLVASLTAHAGKGPWATNGGWELPLTYAIVAIGLAFNGAGAVVARQRDRLERRRLLAGLRRHCLGCPRLHRRDHRRPQRAAATALTARPPTQNGLMGAPLKPAEALPASVLDRRELAASTPASLEALAAPGRASACPRASGSG